MVFKEIEDFINMHISLLVALGIIISILSFLDFRSDIPKFYNSLDIEMKILSIWFLNFALTIIYVTYLLKKFENSKY